MADRPLESEGKRPAWTELNDLAAQEAGGSILFATDDWFAHAENLLSSAEPVWKEGFTEQGKWMDGWETRRKRIPGHDWCIIKLGLPGVISGVEIRTDFFTGNYTPKASIQATRLNSEMPTFKRDRRAGLAATAEQFKEIEVYESGCWKEIVPRTPLGAGYKDTARTFIEVSSKEVYTHIRLNMFPDGGIARLRVYGVCTPLSTLAPGELVDLAAAELGGVCVGYSNAHYGHPRNMIRLGRGKDMGDGWETARKLDRPSILTAGKDGIFQVPGYEWACFRLGFPGNVLRVEVDTNHFKGNYPDSVIIDGCFVQQNLERDNIENQEWQVLLPGKKLGPHHQHFFDVSEIADVGKINHIRVRMFPDGGISRIRVLGHI
ncbi:allantoicase [Eurytemora carolleeae]|uniref:allantoicase n=1 Tax=Eurytemora carolleeae TaxID=1294199 RepID=UPI000C781374|nr:allantoicase [Eurytemora carolleeae]|eukprot:XP_023331244.1 allantoicase-like [Eurytemora affinis]